MAIQHRRGIYKKLTKTKLLPGEYAIVLDEDPFCKDGKSVYICFKAGDTKRMATYEDMCENIENATDEIGKQFTQDVREATDHANEQAEYAGQQGDYAKEQGDYAKEQGDYAGRETIRIQTEFGEIKDIILETDNGKLLLEVKQLLSDLYRIATKTDIDNIINDISVEEDDEGNIFDVGSYQDIDEMIGGEFVEGEEDDVIDDLEIKAIVDQMWR